MIHALILLGEGSLNKTPRGQVDDPGICGAQEAVG